MARNLLNDRDVMVAYATCGCPPHMHHILDLNEGAHGVLDAGRQITGYPLVCQRCHRVIEASIIDPYVKSEAANG